jgi:arylsulfatase
MACASPETTGSPNFLFITIDALRADHMGIYGYERNTSRYLDKFFRDGTVYEYAYSTEANTGPSVVSFLSGTLPQDNGVRLMLQHVPEDMMLVSDYLTDAGYHTAGIVSNIVLTSEATSLNLHFDYFDDYVDEKEPYRNVYERNARATTDAGIQWMVTTHDPKKPFFLWLHYQDPHGPYHPPPDKPVSFSHDEPLRIDIRKVPNYQRERGLNDGLEYVDLYDEEIAYMDHHVGRLLNSFKKQGLLKNTVVIFSADHGESMMEHERWFTHGYHVYDEIIRVPLLFRFPDSKPSNRVPDRVSLLDLMPTFLNLAGLEPPSDIRGRVIGSWKGDRPVYAQGGQWRSLHLADRKWIINVKTKDPIPPIRHASYELDTDPMELHPMEWLVTDEAERFFKLIENDPDPGGIPAEYKKGYQVKAPKLRPGLDKETLKKLRSLGYVN